MIGNYCMMVTTTVEDIEGKTYIVCNKTFNEIYSAIKKGCIVIIVNEANLTIDETNYYFTISFVIGVGKSIESYYVNTTDGAMLKCMSKDEFPSFERS